MPFGSWGEGVAERYLQRKGFTIIEKNFKCKTGEIDLIAYKESCLIFIEVKTRSSLTYGLPCEAITPTKLKHIKNTIAFYRKKNGLENLDLRIDVIEILYLDGQTYLHHIENID